MSKPRVLVTSNDVPLAGLELLRTKCEVTIVEALHSTRKEVLEALPGHDAVFIIAHHVVNKEFLDIAGPTLKVVSTMSAGYEHLDVTEIKKRGIKVGHTPKVLSVAVAELAIMLALSAARRAHEGRLKLEEGKMERNLKWMLGHEINGSTVGIIGLGNIGETIMKRLRGFDVKRFLYMSRTRKQTGDDLGAEWVSFDTFLQESDFIFVTVPLTTETEGMFNDAAFNKMKRNAVFVNVSRGKVVDTDALVRALRNNVIFAAGLDVTDPEPLPTDHELLKLPNAVIMPHLGSATMKTRNDMSVAAAQNILNGLQGKSLVYEL